MFEFFAFFSISSFLLFFLQFVPVFSKSSLDNCLKFATDIEYDMIHELN